MPAPVKTSKLEKILNVLKVGAVLSVIAISTFTLVNYFSNRGKPYHEPAPVTPATSAPIHAPSSTYSPSYMPSQSNRGL